MKKLIMYFAVVVFLLSSCAKEEQYSIPENEQWDDTEWDDGSWDDENWDDSEDNSGSTGEGGVEGALSLYEVNRNEITLIRDYQVAPNLQAEQDNKEKHEEIWTFLTTLIPLAYRDKIAEFELFDGGGELLGYVTPVNEDDLSGWRFGLAIDEASGLDEVDFSNDFTYTAIHEFGHVQTLSDDQIRVGNEGGCTTYHTGEGCSRADSYIQAIYEIGWADILEEHQETGAEAIYSKYRSRFLSDYAATNPGEDIAEVFTFFIIEKDRPTGNTIAEQKIKALYTFPELVQLRTEIRSSMTAARLSSLSVEAYKALLPRLATPHTSH